MRIGLLRKRITIQSETQTTDSAGGYTLGWTDVAVVWGAIQPLNGREVFAASDLQGRVTHRVTIRPPAVTVTPDMRLLWNSRIFNIHSVQNVDELNHWLELEVEDGGAV